MSKKDLPPPPPTKPTFNDVGAPDDDLIERSHSQDLPKPESVTSCERLRRRLRMTDKYYADLEERLENERDERRSRGQNAHREQAQDYGHER